MPAILTYNPPLLQNPADIIRADTCDTRRHLPVPPLKGLWETRTVTLFYRALSPDGDGTEWFPQGFVRQENRSGSASAISPHTPSPVATVDLNGAAELQTPPTTPSCESPRGDSLPFRTTAIHPVVPQSILNSEFLILNWTYTFSAKEKDSETGLSYFGSRYYSSDLSIWLSVDPMSDYYPELSPYVYCNNNPLSLIDFYGEDFVNFINRLSEDPPQPPTDQNNPQKLPEVVITPKPSSNISSKSENVALNARSKATVLTLPFPFVLGNVIECITAAVSPVWPIISVFPVMFRGDSSPTQYEKPNGKNEQHGDGGRAVEKADKQIKDLEKQMKNAKNRVEKRKIKKKIERIRKDAQQKLKGVNHSNGNKR